MRDIHLDDEVVAIAGDWHGNTTHIEQIIRAIRATDARVKTIFQLGDFWPDAHILPVVDRICDRYGIEAIYVTLGNHEPWGKIAPQMREWLGAVPVSRHVHLLQRPQWLFVRNRVFLSLGGAVSVDQEWRTPGETWWPDEAVTPAMAAEAIMGDPIHIMLTHDMVDGSGIEALDAILRDNPYGFPAGPLRASAEHRALITSVWDAVRPALLFHGHMHVPAIGPVKDERQVYSLGCDGQPMNAVLLNVDDLTVTVVANDAHPSP
ncbi:metallophosphoesterase [Microbacterium nymphoidis]|uniref:metallophosphoesterase n=1 Tax=Microbacterium nymphoidis TaxID=2898586 RepID=UPI001E316880|nr:metallophosphoesterase [Microbacterium nymphoidis]MCD2498508.1 metallophosphoesterase [Microbacterium nymphoidis]